jgi:hypothetical protein
MSPTLPIKQSQAAISLQTIVMILLAQLVASNLLLLAFLGLPLALTFGLILKAGFSIFALTRLSFWKTLATPISLRSLFCCALIAVALLLVGGEGRLLHANYDWQVRDSILADMVRNDWPFQYQHEGDIYILRAPLGMYLLPALLAKLLAKLGLPAAQDWTLLACNGVFLTSLLAIGQTIFTRVKARWVALLVVLFVGGFDILGTLLMHSLGQNVSFDHIEGWGFHGQYSAPLTLLFWVPHHALAGWTCAILFWLYQKQKIPIGALAGAMAMVGIWSPLAMMGAFPFAVFAGVQALQRRDFDWRDVALAALGLAIAIPSLIYMRVDPDAVTSALGPRSWPTYIVGLALEVIPFVWLLSKIGFDRDNEKWAVWLAITCLVLFPLYQIGTNGDFQMRGTIMPLMIIAIGVAEFVTKSDQKKFVAAAWVIIAIGSVTGLLEVRRAFTYQASPAPLCNLTGVWFRQDIAIMSIGTYLARTSSMPAQIRNNPALTTDKLSNPSKCWSRPWRVAR